MLTFPVKSKEIEKGSFLLKGKEAHHLAKVLRAKKGESIQLVDEHAKLFEAIIENIGKEVTLKVTKALPNPPPPFPIHLYLSLLKREKLELIIQKAVELNIEAIHLITTSRSILPDISDNKWQRITKIAQEAQKQCGRPIPLSINKPEVDIIDLMKQKRNKEGTNFFFNENLKGKGNTLKKFFQNNVASPPFGIWIGPEGGWSSEEVETAIASNYQTLSLGPLILRSETAALHAISSVIALTFQI